LQSGAFALEVRWTRPGLADFIEAQNYIALDNPQAAARIAELVWSAAERLGDNPLLGRKGHLAHTREWVVADTPYLIVYRLHNDTAEILRVWHAKQNWKNNPG